MTALPPEGKFIGCWVSHYVTALPTRRGMGFGAAAVQIALAGAADRKASEELDEAEQVLGSLAGWSKSIANADDLSSCF